jgi:hypothetical protein
VHLTDLLSHTRVKQDALGAGGLPRIDVRHDPDISGLIELYVPGHSKNRFVLPAVVREGLVCLRHPVHVLLLLHCPAAAIRRVHDFFRQLVGHRLT